EIADLHLQTERVADLPVFVLGDGRDFAGFLDVDLGVLVLDLVHDGAELEQLDLAALLVVLRFDRAMLPEPLPGGGGDRAFDDLDDDVAGKVLLAGDRVDQAFELALDHGVFSSGLAAGMAGTSGNPSPSLRYSSRSRTR